MFCPQCKAEYVEGITECADCHIELVDSLADTEEQTDGNQPITWVPLLSSTYLADIALIESLLESEKIPYWVDGAIRGIVRRGNTGSVIYVDETRLEDAQNLVRDLDLNAFSWSI